MSGQQSWYTSGVYTPQNREAAYTLSQMSAWNQSQGKPFPIQTQPVNAYGRPLQWNGYRWRTFNPATGQYERKRTATRKSNRKSNRRRATRRRR